MATTTRKAPAATVVSIAGTTGRTRSAKVTAAQEAGAKVTNGRKASTAPAPAAAPAKAAKAVKAYATIAPGEACPHCGHRAASPERGDAARRAWETIRANKAAGFQTSAERVAAERAAADKAAAAKAPARGRRKATA
jgi:hypothetical protein